MSYTYEKIASNKVKLTFVIPAEDFDKAMQQAFVKNKNRFNIPGWRKGKAPRKVVENMYGEGVFYDDAFDAVFPDAYDAAIEESKIEVVDRPELNVEEIGSGKDLKVVAEVYVYPEVTLGEYKGLSVEVEKQTVSDAEVDARIEQDRAKVSSTEEVLDRPVENGDNVNLNYAGTVDGVAFDGGTAENQSLTIGSHQFIPGFEEQMVGMCVAEERDLNVKFPEDYHAEELKGKDAVFHVKVNSISKTVMPELDDEFAADVSDFSTFQEYRENIVKELTEQAEKNNDATAENALIEKAAEGATVEIPPVMVERQVQAMLRDMERNMQRQGFTMDLFLKYTGQTREQLADAYRGQAEQRVKVQLVIEAIRKAESLEPDEEEVNAQIAEQAERMGMELEQFEKNLTAEQREYLTDTAAVQKVVDLIKSTATVTEKKPEATEAKDAE